MNSFRKPVISCKLTKTNRHGNRNISNKHRVKNKMPPREGAASDRNSVLAGYGNQRFLRLKTHLADRASLNPRSLSGGL